MSDTWDDYETVMLAAGTPHHILQRAFTRWYYGDEIAAKYDAAPETFARLAFAPVRIASGGAPDA